MKLYKTLLLSGMVLAGCESIDLEGYTYDVPAGSQAIDLVQDRESLIRNPCNGWGIYDDAVNLVANAETYWAEQDALEADKYASFFYVRWRWAEMEPEEGKYVWDDPNSNFNKLIQGALDRGMKLAFRVYENATDNAGWGTPKYVKDAGARGYMVSGKDPNTLESCQHWTPYADDPVFQQKYEKFVKAFAEKFDNPDIVDFVDGYSLGLWGEGNDVRVINGTPKNDVFDWFTSMYADNFKNILMVYPFDNPVNGWGAEKPIAVDRKGFGIRRDGLGSSWFGAGQGNVCNNMYGKILMIGECAYWGGYTEDYLPFKTQYNNGADPRYAGNYTWRKAYELSYADAMNFHYNTLDLRRPLETKGWTLIAPDLVHDFMINGGYRIYPTFVVLPYEAKANATVSISHSWKNTGNGYLPNNMKNWNYKYQVAFGLLDKDGNCVKLWVDEKAEPSSWLKNVRKDYQYEISLEGVPSGDYQWGVAIVDKTRDYKPGINLSVKDKEVKNGWVVISDMKVK